MKPSEQKEKLKDLRKLASAKKMTRKEFIKQSNENYPRTCP